jgi:hypothetical protein
MQQNDILAQDVVKLIGQAVLTAAMYRNGRSVVLSGACLESSPMAHLLSCCERDKNDNVKLLNKQESECCTLTWNTTLALCRIIKSCAMLPTELGCCA